MSRCWTLLILALLHFTSIDNGTSAASTFRAKNSNRHKSDIEADVSGLLDRLIQLTKDGKASRLSLLADLPFQFRQLTGVTFIDGFIYATSEHNNAILVYDGTTPSFKHVNDVVIQDLKFANDLTADPAKKLLYVADQSMCIWKFDVATSRSSVLFQTTFSPKALWFNQKTRQLVVVADGSANVYIFDVDSDNVRSSPTVVSLPRELDPKHAVSTDRGTYLVAHTARSKGNSLQDNVTEFDSTGHVLRSFGGKRGGGEGQLNTPSHLAVKADGSILVADWLNGRIVQLNDQLQFAGHVVEGVPVTRLYLASVQNMLIAGQRKNIGVYRL